jgi:peptidoglycan/LPS O-acetylase OafA/YrhL
MVAIMSADALTLATMPQPTAPEHDRLQVLDGWRAVSILLVLIGHLVPINAILPGSNEAASAAGMAIFFTLSGFLITRFLLDRPEWRPFLIRRIFRILPLAWLAVLILFVAQPSANISLSALASNMLFISNLPPHTLLPNGGHLWSLSLEMQFYLGIALLVACLGRRGLLLLPLLMLAVTALRISTGQTINITTWFRLDEILAGATLALIHAGLLGDRVRNLLAGANFYLMVALAILFTYWIFSPLAYARPYAIAAMVGVTLWHAPGWVSRLLCSRPAAYIATISYALYVVHGMLMESWLGTGPLLEKYLKRPVLFAITFGLAHISTKYFEAYFIAIAKRMTMRPTANIAT